MSDRSVASPSQLHRQRWVFCYDIPWLPDLLARPSSDGLGNPIQEAFGRQIAFLRAVAGGAPVGSALQLRFTSDAAQNRLTCRLIGGADDEADAKLLSRIIATALPTEFPLEPIATGDVADVLRVIDPDELSTGHLAEIRRGIGRLDPTVEQSVGEDLVLYPWTWSRQAMVAALGLIQQQPGRALLVVHVEPEVLPGDTAQFLQDEVSRMVRDVVDGEGQALTKSVAGSYQRWLRVLPKDSLSLRLLVAADSPLVPGLVESLSTDLTRTFEIGVDGAFGAADVVYPTTGQDLDACAQLLDELRGVGWRQPENRQLARLLHMFDPLEANVAFRLPVTPRGGLPGVASQRPDSMHSGAEVRRSDEHSIRIGRTTGGAAYGLTLQDLNQHVLVAGLPGFGKTSTVQLLLRDVFLDAGVPFLVIDPAKSDYGALFRQLRASGVDVGVHRLDSRSVAFNPMATPEGVSPAVHAGRLLAAFDAALRLSDVFPLAHVLLQRAVYLTYDKVEDGGPQPTFAELYRVTGDLIERSTFKGEARANLMGSLLGRLEVLATASTGRALSGGPEDAIPWRTLLSRPTLIEVGSFAGPSERSLLFGLLIAGLVSYREAHPSPGLGHLTVLEEAHRLLRPGTSTDSGVEVFVDAIAELRGAGEGFVIVDQTPSLLHPGVLKLTGSKLAHRLVEQDERERVGASMVLDPEQREDLARLARGRLVAYAATGANASLVEVDPLDTTFDLDRSLAATDRVPLESAILAQPVTYTTSLAEDPIEARLRCIGCPVMCTGTDGLPHLPALVDAIGEEPLQVGRLLRSASELTGRAEAAYCLSAEYVTARYGSRPSVATDLRQRLAHVFHQARRAAKAPETPRT